jgi:hypothetical protein
VHEAVVVAEHASVFGNEAEPPVELVGAGIAGQRVDHDGRHRRLGKAYLERSLSNGAEGLTRIGVEELTTL